MHCSLRTGLTHIIHERFYCNRRYAAATSLAVVSHGQASRLALRGLNILFQVCFGLSGLRVPVSPGVLAVSPRTVMNNVGYESIEEELWQMQPQSMKKLR